MLPIVCMLMACQPVRDAQRTVAVADSLRVNEGVICNDSLALADAYTTLGQWRLVYPDDYARACYYYGRMLRNRNDQVAAMRAFISGTHAPYVQRVVPLPWFSDYHILGRIYSNMGTMCHLAGDYSRSACMYQQSSEEFIKSGDSILYYYALNAIAIEKAELKLHDETSVLLDKIEHECKDRSVLTKTWETKAILYRNIEKYDSAVYAARMLYACGYNAASGYVVMAQSHWFMQQYDSAVHYARYVMGLPSATDYDKYRMIFILTDQDSGLSDTEKHSLSTERADLDNDTFKPTLKQLSAGLEQLRRDIAQKPSLLKLVLLSLSILVIVITIWLILMRIRRTTLHELEKRQYLIEENMAIQKDNDIIKQQYISHHDKFLQQLESNCATLRNMQDWKKELHWKDYKEFCKSVDHYFLLLASKLKGTYNLDEKEIRLCVLVMLDTFSNKQLAKHLYYSESGIGTFKYRVSQKLNIQSKDLRNFLYELAVSGTPQKAKI